MGIVSTLANITDERGQRYLVLDTSCDGKRFVTGIAVSKDLGQHLSEVGKQVVRLATIHHQAQDHPGPTRCVEVAAEASARQRVRECLAAVDEGALVLFFGVDDGTCAALMRALGLRGVRRSGR